MSTYKTIGHTPSGIEVQKDEEGFVRLCRGANIIADEYEGRFVCGDVTVQMRESDNGNSFLDFNYFLVSTGGD